MAKPLALIDQSCNTFALSADISGKRDINQLFMELTDQFGFEYNFGEGLSQAKLFLVRQLMMESIAKLRDETALAIDELYLCGGFRAGQVSPEHTWLENRSSNITYDTMAGAGVVKIKKVGIHGEPFQPGCEADPFEANEIFRVKVSGYTAGQVAAIFPSELLKLPLFFREFRDKDDQIQSRGNGNMAPYKL